ncbi:hypothetical protein LCGC14_3034560, partial [marine sediment metagenome]
YNATPTYGAWNTVAIGAITPSITEYRVRFQNIHGSTTYEARINDFDFQDSNEYRWDIDYIFLCPADEGLVIVDSVAAADILAIDSITYPPAVFKIDATDKVQDMPNFDGKPFYLGRENTRIYILRDDVPAVTFALDTKYQPRHLVV